MDPNDGDPPPPGATAGPPPNAAASTSPPGPSSTSSTEDSTKTTPTETKRVTGSPTTVPPHVNPKRGGAINTPEPSVSSLTTTRRAEEESYDKSDTAKVKGTQDNQDAEGRMDEKSRAPRTNPENSGLSDPKQPGFDLDPSDGKAHDPPTETRSKPTKQKPKNIVYALQSKYDGLQKDVDTFQTKLDGLQFGFDDLQIKMDQMNTNFNTINANFAQLIAKLSPSPTADVKPNSENATAYAPKDPTTDATIKEPSADINPSSEDATT